MIDIINFFVRIREKCFTIINEDKTSFNIATVLSYNCFNSKPYGVVRCVVFCALDI